MSEAALREKYSNPLPPALAAKKAEVEALMRGETPPPAPVDPAGGQAVPGGTGGEGTQPQPVVGAPPASPPATPPEPEPAKPPAEDTEALKRQLALLEQEARTWKGRATKAADEQKALESRLSDLEARLADATKAPAPDPVKEPTPEEVENYGADLLDVARRYVLPDVERRIAAAIEPILARLDSLNTGVGQTAAEQAKAKWDAFCERLAKHIPKWKEIDVEERWLRWLDEEDPIFGLPNRKALVDACNVHDDVRAAKVFERYLIQQGRAGESRGTESQGKPAAGTEPAPPATAQPAEDTRPTLEDLAAPGKPASSQAAPLAVPPGAKVWTVAEITEYYRARSKADHPHYRDEAARLAMDTEIAAAQREGRVR